MADAHFDPTTEFPVPGTGLTRSGAWVTEDGTPIHFLPDEPAQSPPHELIATDRDPDGPHGHKHYPIGGNDQVVAQIVKWYADRGKPVPDGYAAAGAAHAQLAADIAAGKTTQEAHAVAQAQAQLQQHAGG